VIDVSVGDKNLLELEAKLGEALVDAAHFVAGIDDNSLAGLLVAQDRAIALQRADGKSLKNHCSILVSRFSGSFNNCCYPEVPRGAVILSEAYFSGAESLPAVAGTCISIANFYNELLRRHAKPEPVFGR
jgi:hypothetical protein